MSSSDLNISFAISGFVIIFFLLKWLLNKKYSFFAKQNVAFMKPIPLFGTTFNIVFGYESYAYAFQRWYNEFPTKKIFGIFEFIQPVYFVRDPEIVKQILVRDFDSFVNHRHQMDEEIEPGFGRTLFLMKDQRWRKMRATLSPAFTGSKMRNMFHFVNFCAKRTCEFVLEDVKDESVMYDMKDLFTRYSTDVIASCAFGIEINTLKDRNSKFLEMGGRLTKMTGLQKFLYFWYSAAPNLMKFLRIRFYDAEILQFFRDLVQTTTAYREKNGIVRPDMLHLLIDARKGNLKNEGSEEKDAGFATVFESESMKNVKKVEQWHDDDIMAQCVQFFFAGYETLTTTIGFLAYELAVNEDIQNRLIAEIDEVRQRLGTTSLDYTSLQQMKYLDMVICEAMRRWPSVCQISRLCTKPTKLEIEDGRTIQVNVGDAFWLPTYAIQNDPKYFPNPNKFDPERFADDNLKNIADKLFFPFGLGPRNCIGSRFALMEMKAIIFHLLSFVQFEVCEKTQVPLKLSKDCFFLIPEAGYKLNIRRRRCTP